MSIVFLLTGNDEPGHVSRCVAVCDALSRAGESPVLFSQIALPLSVLRRYPTRWMLPPGRSSAAEQARAIAELIDYARLSYPAIVFEDSQPSDFSLPADIFRVMVAPPAKFSDLLWLQQNYGETYSRFLVADWPGSPARTLSAAETNEVLSWKRWRVIEPVDEPGHFYDAEITELLDAHSSFCAVGKCAPDIFDDRDTFDGEAANIADSQKSLAEQKGPKRLIIRVDQVIDLDEGLRWLLDLLRKLNLCASLETAPYLCRISDDDLDEFDNAGVLFEVSQHGYAQLPATFGDDRKGEFSAASADPTCLEIENLRAGFERLAGLFPRRFKRGFSPPFDSIPDWLPQIWRDAGGQFVSCIKSRPHCSTIPVIRLYTDFWDWRANHPRSVEAILGEIVSQFANQGQAGFVVRPQEFKSAAARQRFEKILETLLGAGASTIPLSAAAVKQADYFTCDESYSILNFDFTLRRDNLDDAISFLDLCEEHRATPRYDLDPASWNGDASVKGDYLKRLLATLESLDKELGARGFSEAALETVFRTLARLLPRNTLKKLRWPHLIYGDTTDAGMLQVARGLKRVRASSRLAIVLLSEAAENKDSDELSIERLSLRRPGFAMETGARSLSTYTSEIGLFITDDADEETVRSECATIAETTRRCERESNRLIVYANSALKAHWSLVRDYLKASNISEYSIQIPYYDRGRRTSALEWRDLANMIKTLAAEQGWSLLGGRPDPCALGLVIRNQYPEATVKFVRRWYKLVDLSIVSPIYNRASQLPAFIESVRKQEFSEPFELVLVDDGSNDDSAGIAEELCSQLDERINAVLISLERDGSHQHGAFTFRAGAARQRGIEFALGEQIVFLDPDQELAPNCIAQHRLWNKRGFGVVIGDRLYNFKNNYISESIYRARLSRRALQLSRNWWLSFYTGNSSVSRALLDTVGGFDESLQYWGLDDTDLGYRLAQAGATFWHTQRAAVLHIDQVASGGGESFEDRERSSWLIMEVLFRKYLDDEILDAYRYLWDEGRSWNDALAQTS